MCGIKPFTEATDDNGFPKAKPSRKIDGKGAKKSQLQAALQQHSQQLAQLQQLQQLNQQLQQQVGFKIPLLSY